MTKYFMKDNFDKDIYKLIQEKKKYNEELKQLENDTHPGYLLSVQKIDENLKSEIIKLKNMCQFKIDEINQEHEVEMKLLEKEANDIYREYIDHAINELDSKRRLLENEKNTIDINTSNGGDILDIKPMNTRKLRRRGQDSTSVNNESFLANNSSVHESTFNNSTNISLNSAAITIGSNFIANFNPDVTNLFGVGQGFGPSSLPGNNINNINTININNNNNLVSDFHQSDSSAIKRKRLNGAVMSVQLNTILPESSINSDLLKIQRSCGKNNSSSSSQMVVTSSTSTDSATVASMSRRHSAIAPLHTVNINDKQLFRSDRFEAALPQIWVDDGRLFLGNKCINQNMQVLVESRDNNIYKCASIVLCIGVQDITLKRLSDNGIFKVPLQHIRNGKTVLSPYSNNTNNTNNNNSNSGGSGSKRQ